MINKCVQLRKMLQSGKLIVAPGAYDGISARLVEKAGFPAIYVTGAGVASSRLGLPDMGLTTMIEALEAVRNIVNVTSIPVICDADTGYGNALNLIRTVREFEKIGVAALQIEDQVTPKRCGHTEGKQLITKEEMVKKIEAFRFARTNDDLVLIARTDAIAVNGFDDAIERARAYAAAGADVIFVEAPCSVEQLKAVVQALPGVLLLVNMVEGGGKTPILPASELEAIGFNLAIYPTSVWMASIYAIQKVLQELKIHGTPDGYADKMVSFEEMFELVDRSGYMALEKRFLAL
ncbi:MAG: oxaloacetate decarboxylase [Desulfobacterales bacterium]|nr:oxaloacetate decarboxylase [Desulfobacterales bacterium]MDD4073541.1 oxaloacetate decarboxylase [Desulfobacterales bacterium]MDD4394164.1 oxaloacetate decarboxylase [Desulfobacterales bacterium]